MQLTPFRTVEREAPAGSLLVHDSQRGQLRRNVSSFDGKRCMHFAGFPGFFSAGEGFSWSAGEQTHDVSRHYETLGLAPGATSEEVRRAYRRLAVVHHPDKGGDVEKFRAISEAYEAIGDPQKSAPAAGVDFFSGLFQPGPAGKARALRTPDVLQEEIFTLEELYSGCARALQVSRIVVDETCPPRSCSACRGTGAVSEVRRIGPMEQHLRTRCHACGGEGQIFTKKTLKQSVDVYVPRGAFDGHRIVVRGMAHEAPGATTGDLVCVVRQREHPVFRRRGADLYVRRSVSLCAALCGFRLSLVHLDGRRLLLSFCDVFRPRRFAGEPRPPPLWETFFDTDCPDAEVVAVAHTSDPAVLRRACEKDLKDRGVESEAFVVEQGSARCLRGTRAEALARCKDKPGCVLHVKGCSVVRAEELLPAAVGEGMPILSSNERGNLFVEIDVIFPERLSEAQKEVLRSCLGGEDPCDDGSDADEELKLVDVDPSASLCPPPQDSPQDPPSDAHDGPQMQCQQQ